MAQQAGVGQGGVKVAEKAEESENERKSLSGNRISSLGSGVRKGFGQMQRRPQLWGKRNMVKQS